MNINNSNEVAVIGCGGAGCNIVSGLDPDCDLVPMTVNVVTCDGEVTVPLVLGDLHDCRGDPILGWTATMDNRRNVMALVKGKSAVISVAVLGGGTGSGSMSAVLDCIKRSKVLSIAVVGIPFSEEASRREMALEQLQGIIRNADRTLVFDMDRLRMAMGGNVLIFDAISMVNSIVCNAICRMTECIKGPFFSVFSEKVYTISFVEHSDSDSSLLSAMCSSLISADPSHGKIVVSLDPESQEIDKEGLSLTICNKTGIVPELISSNIENSRGLVLFIPIAYRAL